MNNLSDIVPAINTNYSLKFGSYVKISLCIIVFLQNTYVAYATGDSTVNHKHKVWEYLNLNIDEDYLNIAGKGTDQYYTAGWRINFYYKQLNSSKSIIHSPLITLAEGDNIFFYGLSRKIFTPVDLSLSNTMQGDRPYASVVTVRHGVTSFRERDVLSVDYGIGAIGQITFGGELQKWFHQMIGDQVPQGWNNQIRNDLILDYKLNYQFSLHQPAEKINVSANVDFEAGTLIDNFGLGFTISLGKVLAVIPEENFMILNRRSSFKKLQAQFYIHPIVRALVYDASLEGGFFSERNPYVIKKTDLNYAYFQYDMGIVLSYKRFALNFFQKTRTAEYKTAEIFQYAGIAALLAFD